jgi:hypothetical protein
LDKELDLGMVDAFYKTLQDLVTAAPKLFVELGKAVVRYWKRRGGF